MLPEMLRLLQTRSSCTAKGFRTWIAELETSFCSEFAFRRWAKMNSFILSVNHTLPVIIVRERLALLNRPCLFLGSARITLCQLSREWGDIGHLPRLRKFLCRRSSLSRKCYRWPHCRLSSQKPSRWERFLQSSLESRKNAIGLSWKQSIFKRQGE